MHRGEPIKDGSVILGYRTKCKVVKNKVAPPFKVAEFDMIFGEGISKLGEIIDCAVEFGIIKKSGSWFSYDDMKIGQGKDKVKEYLRDNAEICAEIEKKVREEFARQSDAGEEPAQNEGETAENGSAAKSTSKTTKTTKKTKSTSTKKAEPDDYVPEDDEFADEFPADDDFAEFVTEDVE